MAFEDLAHLLDLGALGTLDLPAQDYDLRVGKRSFAAHQDRAGVVWEKANGRGFIHRDGLYGQTKWLAVDQPLGERIAILFAL